MTRQELSFSEKLALTKKARRLSEERFQQLCKNYSLSNELVALWVDSFEAGGEMGLRALDESLDAPFEEFERAMNVVKLYLEYKFPKQKFHIRKRKNKLTVSRGEGDGDQDVLTDPIFQIRYFETKSKKPLWLLYWLRKDGKWWPYVTKKQRIYKIDQLMEEVVTDVHQHFWNHD